MVCCGRIRSRRACTVGAVAAVVTQCFLRSISLSLDVYLAKEQRGSSVMADGGGSDSKYRCEVSDFQEYYRAEFQESPHVPFSAACLEQLIERHPERLDVRAAFVRRRYAERMAELPGQRRRLFYLCDQSNKCGGHGDRLRGMGRTFYLALAADAKFSVFVGAGLNWEAYFRPLADLDWTGEFLEAHGWARQYYDSANITANAEETAFSLKRSLLAGSVRCLHVEDCFTRPTTPPAFRPRDNRWLSALFPPNVTVATVESNKGLSAFCSSTHSAQPGSFHWQHYYRLAGLSHAKLYHIFLQLYAASPSALLQQAMQPYLDQLSPQPHLPHHSTNFVIGMHIRMGDAIMHRYKPLPNGKRRRTDNRNTWGGIQCMTQKARLICDQWKQTNNHLLSSHNSTFRNLTPTVMEPKCSIFVLADIPAAIKMVQQEFQNSSDIHVVTAEGDIFHTIDAVMDITTVVANKNSQSKQTNQTITTNTLTNSNNNVTITPVQKNMRTFVDWYLLATSDATLISVSGFSYMASILQTNGTHIDHRPSFILRKSANEPNHCVMEEWNENTYHTAKEKGFTE